MKSLLLLVSTVALFLAALLFWPSAAQSYPNANGPPAITAEILNLSLGAMPNAAIAQIAEKEYLTLAGRLEQYAASSPVANSIEPASFYVACNADRQRSLSAEGNPVTIISLNRKQIEDSITVSTRTGARYNVRV